MPYQVDDALLHAMSGTELSRVRTELRLLPPEPNNQRLLASREADIVMQSSGFRLDLPSNYRDDPHPSRARSLLVRNDISQVLAEYQ